MGALPPLTCVNVHPNTGASNALNVKLMKLTTPVAVPLMSGGLTSLMTVYGIIAAPEAMPATRPRRYGGNTSGDPNRIHASVANSTAAPPTITGLRRPIRSETKPRSGHPTIHPSGTTDDRSTADA